MSTKLIDYNILLKRDGQTQQQRMPALLDPDLVKIDDRTKEDYFNYIKTIANEIKFYDLDGNGEASVKGTWKEFFDVSIDDINALAAVQKLPPHLALWNAFMEVYGKAQEQMNTITKRHLDFYYQQVLGLQRKPAIPDKAHLIFELKKNTPDTLLPAGTAFLAGKTALKKDVVYKLEEDIIVNRSAVSGIKSIYASAQGKNEIHFAQVANSADGLGAPLTAENKGWSGFGNKALPLAQIGFCLAGNILNMKEGERTVNVKLTLRNLPANATNESYTKGLFNVSITGEKGWIGPQNVSAVIASADNQIFTATFSLTISKDLPAVIPYNAAIHGLNFDTQYPLLQILLNNNKTDFGYRDMLNCELADATIEVTVSGIKNLQLENDLGALNSKKPFLPFGPAPEASANFTIGCKEAFSKRLKDVSVNVSWKNIPSADLSNYYSNYPGNNSNASFAATAAFQDGYGWNGFDSNVKLFNTNNATSDVEWSFHNNNFPAKINFVRLPEIEVAKVRAPGVSVYSQLQRNISYLSPAFSALRFETEKRFVILPFIWNIINTYKNNRKGILNLRLNRSFLFKEYRDVYAKAVLQYAAAGNGSNPPNLPNAPFAPEIQSIELNYTATTAKTSFDATSLNDFADAEIELFHYGVFGQMREHAYNRSKHDFISNLNINLLPRYDNEGELYIGISGIEALSNVSLLFQVAEGSANPNKPTATIAWSILCDNYWRSLDKKYVLADSTNNLLASGIIKLYIPPEATTDNSILPTGQLWIKGAVAKDADGVCLLNDIKTNAARAVYMFDETDTVHLAAALSAATITKFVNKTDAVKSVTQPYASFGGRYQENNNAFYTRASERLRHKDRSINLWDYERLILENFPQVFKVKCINHATLTSFYQPGNVLIIAIPDLTNKTAADTLQPKVDKNTLDEIQKFLVLHSGAWVMHHISNPLYEPIKVSATVELNTGYEFNYYKPEIEKAITNFLSPWAGNQSATINFSGRVTHSMIVQLLENLAYVNHVTGLKIFRSVNGIDFSIEKDLIEPTTPASVLVSAYQHDIINDD